MDDQTRKDFMSAALSRGVLQPSHLMLSGDSFTSHHVSEMYSSWQAAKEQYAPQWISVEDSLPDEAQVILVKDRIEMILKVTFIRGQFPLFDTHRCVSDVTHWMPISQLGDKE